MFLLQLDSHLCINRNNNGERLLLITACTLIKIIPNSLYFLNKQRTFPIPFFFPDLPFEEESSDSENCISLSFSLRFLNHFRLADAVTKGPVIHLPKFHLQLTYPVVVHHDFFEMIAKFQVSISCRSRSVPILRCPEEDHRGLVG